MSDIKCFELERLDYELYVMEESESGDYVLYEEHVAIVEAMQEKIDSLTSMLRNMWA